MRKRLSNNNLGIPRADGPRRSAFSLAELVVSLGILVLMLSLAGQVFNFTVQSTGQATALVELNQRLRAFEQTIRDDLRYVVPGQCPVLIQGNPVNAYWTAAGKESDNDTAPNNGYPGSNDPEREFTRNNVTLPLPPRADILMFFTSRRAKSYVDPAVTANLQQVVYGHAELGEYVPAQVGGGAEPAYEFQGILESQNNPTLFPVDRSSGYPDPREVCEIPASQWHLARRNVLIAPEYMPLVNPPGLPDENIQDDPVAMLDDPRLLNGMTDIIAAFIAAPGALPEPFDYDNHVQRPAVIAPPIESEVHPSEVAKFGSWQLPRIFAFGQQPHARSLLDLTPPPLYAGRLGHYLLPNCASFKVEWTLDPKSSFVAGRLDGMTEVLWFDPGYVNDENHYNPDPVEDDPLVSLEAARDRATGFSTAPGDFYDTLAENLNSLLTLRSDHSDGSQYALVDRFRGDVHGDADINYAWTPMAPGPAAPANLIVFTATRGDAATGELVPDDVFPSALRITVDVFDDQGRLERPIRHVMVIPVGQ